MGLFSKKLKELESKEESRVNLLKATSDIASDVIKELSGRDNISSKKVLDNVIVFSNAAGGTGASTIVSNVAYEMSQKNLKVILIDLNITRPTQHTYLGIRQEIKKSDLISYLVGESNLGESIDTSNKVNLMYANNRSLNDLVACESKIVVENASNMLKKLRNLYDVVLIDCPMNIEHLLCNTILYECDTIYLVWDEGIGSTIHTEKVRRDMALSGIDSYTKLRIILNKRTSIHFSDYAIKKLGLELVEVLPFALDVIDNGLRGRVFCDKGTATTSNGASFARKISKLTTTILKIGGYVED